MAAAFALLLIAPWRLLLALLDGAIVFIPTAALAGFLAWIGASASPRDWALGAGLICGGLWAFGTFAVNMVQCWWVISERVQKDSLERALRRLDP